jgi:DNA-binding CsgD family transcriptional regulator
MRSLSAANLSSLGALGDCVERWCRGLLIENGQQVLEVAQELAATNRAGLAAQAFEDAGDVLARTRNSTTAAIAYAAAFDLLTSAGAASDVARITQNRRGVPLAAGARPGRPAAGWASLTPSEIQVARHVVGGLRNRDIAEQLVISRHTVESHLKHIFTKLDVQSRVELALLALRHLEP